MDVKTGRWSSVVVGVVFQAEDGIRDLVRSRGRGDVYKRQMSYRCHLKKYVGDPIRMRSIRRGRRLLKMVCC